MAGADGSPHQLARRQARPLEGHPFVVPQRFGPDLVEADGGGEQRQKPDQKPIGAVESKERRGRRGLGYTQRGYSRGSRR